MQREIAVNTDKPGREVAVEATMGRAYLEVGGLIGESQWTGLTPSEARQISDTLSEAADAADRKKPSRSEPAQKSRRLRL
jgi:hypothetical protein